MASHVDNRHFPLLRQRLAAHPKVWAAVLPCCRAKRNNFGQLDLAVDNPWLVPERSTGLSLSLDQGRWSRSAAQRTWSITVRTFLRARSSTRWPSASKASAARDSA